MRSHFGRCLVLQLLISMTEGPASAKPSYDLSLTIDSGSPYQQFAMLNKFNHNESHKLWKLICGIFILITAGLCSLFILEAALRLWHRFDSSYKYPPWSYEGGRHLPIAKLKIDANGSPIFVGGYKTYLKPGLKRYYVSYDRNGYRTSERADFEAKGVKIGVFGDSFTENLQVPEGKSFSNLLENKLNRQSSNASSHVFNFGVGKTGTCEQYWRYLTVKNDVKLDYVILAFLPQNDVSDNQYQTSKRYRLVGAKHMLFENGQLKEILEPAGSVWLDRQKADLKWHCRALINHSYALSLILQLGAQAYANFSAKKIVNSDYLAGGNRHAWLASFGEPPNQEWRNSWAITEECILRMHHDAEKAGSTFILLILTGSMQIDHPADMDEVYDFRYPHSRLSQFAKTHGIRYLDTYDLFMEEKKKLTFPYFSFTQDGHYSEVGTEFVAKLLFEYFQKNLLIKS